MAAELVLHIGYYKTGSTALQEHLGAGREQLRAAGVLYPEAGSPGPRKPNQSAVAFQIFHELGLPVPGWFTAMQGYERIASGDSSPCDELIEEVRGSHEKVVVVSSEELIRFGGGVPSGVVKQLLAGIGAGSTTVVCYVRRPDRYLTSWYNQCVKLGLAPKRLSASIDEYLGTEHTDYDRMVSYWMDEVGCDKLVVRDYDALVGGDIVTDFTDATGLPIPDHAEGAVPDEDANPGLNANFVEYARLFSLYRDGTPPVRLNRLLHRMARDDRLPECGPVALLDAEARRVLYDYCVPMNEQLGEVVDRWSADGTGRGGRERRAVTGFFDDLDEMLKAPDNAISDVEAFHRWSPYINAALLGALRNTTGRLPSP